MKQIPEERKIAERMAPGVLCREGFLGADTRPLGEILDADNSTVAGLDLTHEQIAARLGEVLRQAVAGLGTTVRVGQGLTCIHREAMGRIPCPWGRCGTFPKGQAELTEAATGRTLCFTPLSVHLIAAHGFYQGRGSRYRMEPDRLAPVLGMVEEGRGHGV